MTVAGNAVTVAGNAVTVEGNRLYAIGAADGKETIFCFDAQSGAIRWRHGVGGRISGSATIVGSIVYFSNLAAKNTIGLDARTGHQVFAFPDGAFNPVVSDDGTVYLTGYTKLYQMLPVRPKPGHKPPREAKKPSKRGGSGPGSRRK